MKELWVLSERTDFERGGEWDYQNYRSKSYAFASFESAKTAMRKRIVELAKEEGSMFYGGTIDIVFDDDDNNGPLDLQYLLDGMANDENFSIPKDKCDYLFDTYGISSVDADFEEEGWTDWLYGFGIVPSDEPELICHGYDDGPCNGINPYVYINCFVMNNPDKKYSFHIEDGFSDNVFTSRLYIDLEKVCLDD